MAEVPDIKLASQVVVDVAPSASAADLEQTEAKAVAKEAGTSGENKHDGPNAVVAEEERKYLTPIKLEELRSLEQEIAKMHNIEPGVEEPTETAVPENAAAIASRSSSAAENGSSEVKVPDDLAPARCTPVDKDSGQGQSQPTQAPLEEVDLIALLKGTDTSHEQKEPSIELALAELDNVGVTIEGEGQYEIMEIDDGDNAQEMPIATSSTAKKIVATKAPVHNKLYAKTKLSPEQARAVALEQMANLKSQMARRKEAAGAKAQDIISTLNDDWNEYDSGSDSASNATVLHVTKKPAPKKEINPVVSSVVVLKAAPKPKAVAATKLADKASGSGAKVTTALPSAEGTETTGFKRTRIIKRKIIWDPDVPETQKSYSQYASAKPAPTATAIATNVTKAATVPSTSVVVTVTRKEPAPKKPRPATPATVRAVSGSGAAVKEPLKATAKRAATPAKLAAASSRASAPAEVANTTPAKRRSQTPSIALANGNSMAKKKKVSEIDRLMGDEGAANMIQAVEHEQRELSAGSETRETINKPLMRKRALTITGRSPRAAEVRPATPKKEAANSSPKSSKRGASTTAAADAVFGKARASDSWDYVYKQRASEESMIMRRRSNSSYSSNASVNRLSLDNKPNAMLSDEPGEPVEPSFKFLKPENKANQRSSGADGGSSAHTLANDLKRGAQPKASGAPAKTELVALQKLERVAQLVINMQRAKTSHTYNTQLLHKLTDTLNKVAKSNEFNTVLLSVQGAQFCQGIDGQELIAGALEKRKNNASQLATALKTYLKTLATFPKPLVAGIVGNLKNLGVMQLPLLDYVVAADDCSFETNYAKIGQLPEGYALWHNHPKVPSKLHTRLFLLGERLHTSDVVGAHGFVDSVAGKARNVHEEALALAKRISTTTAENYRMLKKSGQTAAANTDALSRLENEFTMIAEQWPTANCQAQLKRCLNSAEA